MMIVAPFLAVVVVSGLVLLWLALPPRRGRRRRSRRSSQMTAVMPHRDGAGRGALADGSISRPPATRPRLPGLTRTRPQPTVGPPRRPSAPRLVPPDAFSDDS